MQNAKMEVTKFELESKVHMNLIYVTTRVICQQDLIVAYYCAPFVNGVIGQEESRPIYVEDIDKLVDEYILKFAHQVIAAGVSN